MKTIITLLCAFALSASVGAQDWQKIAQKDGGAVTVLTSNKYGDLYCAAINQVYRSVDQGQFWQKRKTPIDSLVNVQIYTSCDSNGIANLFAFGSGQIMRSTDDGQSWFVASGLQDSLNQQKLMAMYGSRYGDLVIATRGTGSGVNLLRSRDNGITFEVLTSLESTPISVFQSIDSTYYAFNGSAVRINKDHSTASIGSVMISAATQDFFNAPVAVWGIANNKPMRSTNKGDQWKDMSYDLKESGGSLLSLVGGREGTMYLFWLVPGDSMHVYRLNAGSSSWTRVRDLGYTFRTVIGLSNGSMVASSTLGIFSSEEGATSWTNSSNGISTYPLNGTALCQNAIAVSGQNGVLSQTNSGGISWSTSNVAASSGANQVADMIGTTNGHFVVAGSNGLWVSNDLGLNYAYALLSGSFVNTAAFCVQEVAPKVIYASTSRGLLRSNDDGQNWFVVDSTAIGSSLFSLGDGRFLLSRTGGVYVGDTSSAVLTLLAPLPAGKLCATKEGDMFLVTSEAQGSGSKVTLYRKKASGNIETISIPSASKSSGITPWVVAGKGANAYVNTDAGLFRVFGGLTTADKLEESGEVFSYLRSLDANSAIGCTMFGGVYRLDYNTGIDEQAEPSPSLLSCTPQPATLSLKIHSHVAIRNCTAYTVDGQALSLPTSTPSSHDVVLHTADLAVGVYALHILTEDGRTLCRTFVIAR